MSVVLLTGSAFAQEHSIMAESDAQAYVIGINDTYMHAVGEQRIQELFDEHAQGIVWRILTRLFHWQEAFW